MAYFPESLMPMRTKSESADVDGNQFILGGSDWNRIGDEIRAIEKIVGFSGACSLAGALHGMAGQLQAMRDGLVYTTSGIVAAQDPVYNVTGFSSFVPFPSSWGVTTMIDGIPDDSTGDDDALPTIDSLILTDVTGMPSEGYITVINDVSRANAVVGHQDLSGGQAVFRPGFVGASNFTTDQIYTPLTAVGKVGKPFSYEFLSLGTPFIPAAPVFFTGTLPAGLAFDPTGQVITGTPTSVGSTTLTVQLSSSNASAVVIADLIVTIVDAATPKITSSLTVSTAAGSPFSYQIASSGSPNSFSASPLPSGIELFGSKIVGTPTTAGLTSVVLKVTDQFGDSDTQTLALTVTGNVAGVAAPTISSVSPNHAVFVGGATIGVSGTNFVNGAVVYFGIAGNYTAASTTFVNSTSLTAISPLLPRFGNQLIDVVVQNPDKQVSVLSAKFAAVPQCASAVQELGFEDLRPLNGGPSARTRRILAMGTNVEVMFYSGVDPLTNTIKNVYRKQFGTTSTGHFPGDLVFKGRASIQVSPILYQSDGTPISQLDCYLRSTGKVVMHLMSSSAEGLSSSSPESVTGFSGSIGYAPNLTRAYAGYQATLIRGIDPLPIPQFGQGC